MFSFCVNKVDVFISDINHNFSGISSVKTCCWTIREISKWPTSVFLGTLWPGISVRRSVEARPTLHRKFSRGSRTTSLCTTCGRWASFCSLWYGVLIMIATQCLFFLFWGLCNLLLTDPSSIVRTVGEPACRPGALAPWHHHMTARGQWGHSRVTDHGQWVEVGWPRDCTRTMGSFMTHDGRWRVPPGKTIGSQPNNRTIALP